MSTPVQRLPSVLALFHKRIEGDDSLLELARWKLKEAGLGVEMYAGTPQELEWLLKFNPAPDRLPVVHLPRSINLLSPDSRNFIVDFSTRFAGRLHGLVIHDQAEMADRFADSLQAARWIDSQLRRIVRSPTLFVEYAAGLAPDFFARFFHSVRDLAHLSVCVDVGHLGLWQTRRAYSQIHPGQDVCALRAEHSLLPAVMAEVDRAVRSALPSLLDLIQAIAGREKPVHFHLHDGHPLSALSPFGVSDHLSFLNPIPIPFEYQGRRTVSPMFGPAGLSRIIGKALDRLDPDRVTFTLEIHPSGQRLPLGDAEFLFRHWRETTNAEKMNHWLSVLLQNCQLAQRSIAATEVERPLPAPAVA